MNSTGLMLKLTPRRSRRGHSALGTKSMGSNRVDVLCVHGRKDNATPNTELHSVPKEKLVAVPSKVGSPTSPRKLRPGKKTHHGKHLVQPT